MLNLQGEGVAPFIPKRGDIVVFNAADGTRLIGAIDTVPGDNETWFRVRTPDGATFERRYFEMVRPVSDDIGDFNAMVFVHDSSVDDLMEWKPCGGESCRYCPMVEKLRAERFPRIIVHCTTPAAIPSASMEMDEMCTMTCPHGDRCVRAAGHEKELVHPGIPEGKLGHGATYGCSHRGCFCNEANRDGYYPKIGDNVDAYSVSSRRWLSGGVVEQIRVDDKTNHEGKCFKMERFLVSFGDWGRIEADCFQVRPFKAISTENVRTSDTTERCWRCGREIRDGMVGLSDHADGCPGALTFKTKPAFSMSGTTPLKPGMAIVGTLTEPPRGVPIALSNACWSVLDAMKIGTDDETPVRMAKALLELTCGYGEDLGKLLKTFEGVADDNGIVCVRNMPFASLCEHHVLPFTGTITVAYLPSDRIVGLSKIPRLVRAVTRRLQVQERIGAQIADAFMEHVKARGVMVVIKSSHTCMTLRGVECPGEMVTSTIRGVFANESEHAARAEVLSLISK